MAGTSLGVCPDREIAMGGWKMPMRVRTIMSQQVITVAVTESVREAARRMRSNGISALPVVKGGELVGIISERDLVDALIDGSNPSTALISRYMTAAPQYAGPEDDSSEVALRLLDMGVRHLPVVEAGQVIGMVSARDLLLLEVSPKRLTPPPGSGPSPAAGPAL
jgi:CBS domain-containing protein